MVGAYFGESWGPLPSTESENRDPGAPVGLRLPSWLAFTACYLPEIFMILVWTLEQNWSEKNGVCLFDNLLSDKKFTKLYYGKGENLHIIRVLKGKKAFLEKKKNQN